MDGPRISARALIVREERVLVSTYVDARGTWHVLPGGGQRRGETLHENLIREIREETSLEIKIGRLRWVREFISARHPDSLLSPQFHQVEVTFECFVDDELDAALGCEPDVGQIGLHWLSIENLLSVRFYPHDVARILSHEIPDRLYLGDA